MADRDRIVGLRSAGIATLLATLIACGGGDGGGNGSGSQTGTLAYVETTCRATTDNSMFERQALRIQSGDREPVTVFETPEVGPVPYLGTLLCKVAGGRWGDYSISREAFQAVTVSPDGHSVAFMVTDQFSTNPPLPLKLPAEQKGLFWVRADGTGLRRLGPASRTRFFFVLPSGGVFQVGFLMFNPNGRLVTYTDKGPDADGHEADQVVAVDVATGETTQVTQLPPALPPPGYPADAPTAWNPSFVDDQTIAFTTSANPDGLNPDGGIVRMTIRTDGSHPAVPIPVTIAAPGAVLDQRFVITGNRPQIVNVAFEGTPVNDPPLEGPQEIWEVFLTDEGKNALQLTRFGRVDTAAQVVDVDREHVYLTASADPLGSNPTGNCQLFSITRLGAELRQLTDFRETDHSVRGCYFGPAPKGCTIALLRQNPRTRALVFYSTCDPFGTNPNGGQLFSIQPDGTGLGQLTRSTGLVEAPDGTIIRELPGPWDYGPNTGF